MLKGEMLEKGIAVPQKPDKTRADGGAFLRTKSAEIGKPQ